MEDQIDKLEGESDDATSNQDEQGQSPSFIQVKKHNDDDDAENAEMARMEDQIDKLEGESDDAASTDDKEPSSFIQVQKKHNDDDDAENADMARMEDQIDKLEGESDDATTDAEDAKTD